VLLCVSFTVPPKNITVYLIGDSTMSVKQVKAYPETGWGMPFASFFDQSVNIDNRAQNGRSTKSFLAEGRWAPVVNSLKRGDYVLIQFGHNDEVKTKASSTTVAEFKSNLVRYVNDSRSRKAFPVLITPVARRSFDASGSLLPSHEIYSDIVRTVAQENKVALVDLDKLSQRLLQNWGVEKSKLLYNHLAPGEHPNYPAGKEDNTHFNELGARVMAQLVLSDIQKLKLDLACRIVKPKP
jgi:lysophospholipase L1-like esterase